MVILVVEIHVQGPHAGMQNSDRGTLDPTHIGPDTRRSDSV